MTLVLSALIATGGLPPALAQVDPGGEEADELFAFPPDTPERLVKAAILAEGVDRPELARGYLRRLLDGSPSAEQLLTLRTTFGPGRFLQLNGLETMQPEARELLNLINEASFNNASSDDELAALVGELGGSKQQAVNASARLLAVGDRSVPSLLAADSDTPGGQMADALMRKYVRQFRFGLLAALPDADEATQTRILNHLANAADADLALPLMRYQFLADSDAVRTEAARAVARLLADSVRPRTASATAALLNRTSEELLAAAGKRFPDTIDVARDIRLAELSAADSDDAAYGTFLVRLAARLSRDAAEIQTDSTESDAMRTACEAAAEAWPARWPEDFVLHDSQSSAADQSASQQVAIRALEIALQTRNSASAIRLLSRADVQLAATGDRGDLLKAALASGDPRVRLIAAGLVRKSGRSFAGTSLAASEIDSVASGSAMAEAVVIDSRPEDARQTTQVLRDLSFSVQSATRGQQGFDVAVSQLNPALIVIHSNVQRWSLTATLANLRSDARTRLSPIVVYGEAPDAGNVSSLTATYPGVWFIEEPFSAESFATGLEVRSVPGPLLTDTERQAMIKFAVGLNNAAQ